MSMPGLPRSPQPVLQAGHCRLLQRRHRRPIPHPPSRPSAPRHPPSGPACRQFQILAGQSLPSHATAQSSQLLRGGSCNSLPPAFTLAPDIFMGCFHPCHCSRLLQLRVLAGLSQGTSSPVLTLGPAFLGP